MAIHALTDKEFRQFQAFIFDVAGISMAAEKKTLVASRLTKRLSQLNLTRFDDYFSLISGGSSPHETQTAIDLLTTNETYFFREPKHFNFLGERILPSRDQRETFRVWSAACSSGEEPYSIAMLLADRLDRAPWELTASDISSRVLAKARAGNYPIERTEHIPPDYLKRFCLKGVGSQEGTFIIDKSLRSRVAFESINLNGEVPLKGEYDLIFLRNVMIYFDNDTKRKVVSRLLGVLKPGGHLFIGHSESLQGFNLPIRAVQPAIYQRIQE
jgi:chemotaxis protein methyltransferase CheR